LEKLEEEWDEKNIGNVDGGGFVGNFNANKYSG
jgi:hypothetical protein